MWVRYCRPPIGAHFHPNPQPPPVPQQLGEKAHLRIAWPVGDFMLLFGRWQPTTWRGEFASLCGLKLRIFPKMPKMTSRGQRPPFGTPLVKNPQNEPPRSINPQFTPKVKTPKFTSLTKNHPNDHHGQKPPKLTPFVKNTPNEPPWPKMPQMTPVVKDPL